jgi:aminoglycoside phosphotransferase (APT) family kinase protein
MKQLPATDPRLPWHDEAPLDVDTAAAIIAADLPEFRGAAVERLGDGWDFKLFLVDGRWAFRFPKRRRCARTLEREIALLARLATTWSGGSVDFPRYRYHVEAPRRFAWPYAAYPLLPGTPLVECDHDVAAPSVIGTDLGRFLRQLNAHPPLPRPRHYRDQIAADLTSLRAELDAVASALPPHLAEAGQRALARPPAPEDDVVAFGHGDLGVEHLLVDAGRISAVIDWGDAGWGHPVADLVGLWAWGGDAAVDAALATWQRAFARRDWARLRQRGAAYAIGSAYYGYKDGRDLLFRTALGWLERMYRTGQLYDPELPDG